MEEYTPLIWMVVLIVFMLLNSLSKVRKKAGKAVKRFGEHLPREAWPAWESDEAERAEMTEWEDPARRTVTQVAPAGEYASDGQYVSEEEYVPEHTTPEHFATAANERSVHPNSDTFGYDYHANGSEREATRPGQPQAERASGADVRKAAATPTDAMQESDESVDIAEEFDLRRAVLYSEILKPKFEENGPETH